MSAADEHAERCAKLYARSSIEFLEESIRYHTRLQSHGKATPASIARHQADIAELRAAIEQRNSGRTITSKSRARREAEILEVIECIERERQRIGDEKMLATLRADNLSPPRRLLKIVTATRGPNRTPKPNLRRDASYALMRQQIRAVK